MNVSREMLQESRQLKQIGKKIMRKIIQMLTEIAEAEEAESILRDEKILSS